jgi:hypothetical protein
MLNFKVLDGCGHNQKSQDSVGCDYFRTPVNFCMSDIFVFVGGMSGYFIVN